MILTHARSRGSWLQGLYQNPLGEIFNLHGIDKETFEFTNTPNMELPSQLQRSEFAKNYIKHLRQNVDFSDVCFKLFWTDVMHWPEARDFIIELNPKMVVIHRENRLNTLKSNLLAKRKGFMKNLEVENIDPFEVDFNEFQFNCIQLNTHFYIGYSYFKKYFDVKHVFTYETILDSDFETLLKSEVIELLPHDYQIVNQNSEEKFSLIRNEKEVDGWFKAFEEAERGFK